MNENAKQIGITYQGNVKISIIKNGKEIKQIKSKNTGNIDLFKFLANCMIGDFRYVNAPQYLNIYNDEISSETSLLVSPIYKASNERVDDNNANNSIARIRFLVPGSALYKERGNGNIVAILDSANHILAYIELEVANEIDVTNIPSDANLIVIWELKISN